MKKLFFGFVALSALLFTGCTDEPKQGNEGAKEDNTVTVQVYTPNSRASSEFLEDNIDRFTATRVDLELNAKYALVSYHGRVKEQIGLVQVLDINDYSVKCELYFPDARVNYCAYRNNTSKQVVYFGVDRNNGKTVHCGLVAVALDENGVFQLENGTNEAKLTLYPLPGVSVNCIKHWEQNTKSALIVATGGNNALGTEGTAGFTKYGIDNANPTHLIPSTNAAGNMVSANLRGYWVSNNIDPMLPVAYTYRTVDPTTGDLVYKLAVQKKEKVSDFFDHNKPFGTADAEAEVMRVFKVGADTPEDFGRFGVSMLNLNNARFLIVSTGSKVLDGVKGTGGGTRVYRLDYNGRDGNPELALVDVWNKSCYNTTNLNNGYIYASCGEGGVFKCKVDFYTDGYQTAENGYVNPKPTVPINKIQLIPEKKRTTDVLTPQGTKSSTNYVQCNANMKVVNVAGGFEGFFQLPINGGDWRDVSEPRTDLVKH